MKRLNRTAFAAILAVQAIASTELHAGLINLETPVLGAATHDEDWSPDGGFSSNGAFFNNVGLPFWSGFALSRETNTTIGGYTEQFSGFAGSGASGSLQYAIGYVAAPFGATPVVTLPVGESAISLQITNTTYAALSMRDGDSLAKKFGGVSGNDPDYFKLTITGLAADNTPLPNPLDFYLADFRFANNAQDYILNTWATVDLTTLPAATRKLQFTLSSSDNGAFGMNTPAYFAVDNIATVPEPAAAAFLLLGVLGVASRRKRA